MGSGMNGSQAEEYAKTMTYQEAVRNIVYAKGIRYKKATRIKLHELAEIADKLVPCKDCRYRKKVGTSYYCELDEFNVKDEDFCSWGERRE
jgi:hypothetical protein